MNRDNPSHGHRPSEAGPVAADAIVSGDNEAGASSVASHNGSQLVLWDSGFVGADQRDLYRKLQIAEDAAACSPTKAESSRVQRLKWHIEFKELEKFANDRDFKPHVDPGVLRQPLKTGHPVPSVHSINLKIRWEKFRQLQEFGKRKGFEPSVGYSNVSPAVPPPRRFGSLSLSVPGKAGVQTPSEPTPKLRKPSSGYLSRPQLSEEQISERKAAKLQRHTSKGGITKPTPTHTTTAFGRDIDRFIDATKEASAAQDDARDMVNAAMNWYRKALETMQLMLDSPQGDDSKAQFNAAMQKVDPQVSLARDAMLAWEKAVKRKEMMDARMAELVRDV